MRKRVGQVFVEKKILTQSQVVEVLKHSKQRNMRFGDAAIDLGFTTKEKVDAVFGSHFTNKEVNFRALTAHAFSPVAKHLLSLSEICKFGALPMGFTTDPGKIDELKEVNMGYLDPMDEDSVSKAEGRIHNQMGHRKIHQYLVLPEEFMQVLKKQYDVSRAEVLEQGEAKIHPMLWEFLQATKKAA